MKLHVAIIGATGLADAEWQKKSAAAIREFYCTLKVQGAAENAFCTRRVRDVLDPRWREEASVAGYKMGAALELAVFDAELEGEGGGLLGRALLDSRSFDPDGFRGEVPLKEDSGAYCGFLKVMVRMAGQDFPLGHGPDFHISIENKRRKALGLDIDAQDGTTLYVYGVKGGLVQSNNRVSEAMLTPGNFIVGVNNITDHSAKLQEALKRQSSLTLRVRRPTEFRVLLPTNGATASRLDFAGLQITKKPVGNFLLVTSISPEESTQRPVHVWNAANPDQEVRAGDRILEVNGFTGKAADLLKTLRASKGPRLQLTIVRPADAD